jgi:hypothetical protein
MASKVKSGEIFRTRWIRKAFTNDSGARVAAKTYGVDKTTHATTEMDEIRSQCPATFVSVLEETERKLTALRAEEAQLDRLMARAMELQELLERMQQS